MPVLVSDDDYKEYRTLQHNAIFQQKLDSVRGMRSLEFDIDIPIKNLVAIFALLGCEPLWSCCGFDYEGQPMHKTHEYGNCFVALRNTERSRSVIQTLKDARVVRDLKRDTSEWETWTVDYIIYLRSDFDYFHAKSDYPWSMRSCIHYSELALIYIQNLERSLMVLFKDQLADDVVLSDTNKEQKRRLHNWQYPMLEDWTIKKEALQKCWGL